jgi:hypothetical protein
MLPDMLLKFFDYGYSMGHIHWGMVFAPPNPAQGWGTPPPQMEEIVRRHAEYDKWSAELIKSVERGGRGRRGGFTEAATHSLSCRVVSGPERNWLLGGRNSSYRGDAMRTTAHAGEGGCTYADWMLGCYASRMLDMVESPTKCLYMICSGTGGAHTCRAAPGSQPSAVPLVQIVKEYATLVHHWQLLEFKLVL